LLLLTAAPLLGQQDAASSVQLELLRTISGDGGTVMAAAFSPDGSLLAMGGELGDLVVLDMPAQTVRWRAEPSDHWIGELEFSPDGELLACRGRHLTLHSVKDGRERFRVEHIGPHGFAWSRDGERFAYVNGGRIVVCEGGDANPETWASIDYPVNALSFAVDGALFAGDNVGRLWRVPAGGGTPELRVDHRKDKDDMVRSIDVVCASGKVFDLSSRSPLRCGDREFELPGDGFALAVTSDGRSFAAGGKRRAAWTPGERKAEQVVRWWTEGGNESHDLEVPGTVGSLAFHPDGKTLFVGTYAGAALYRRGQEPRALPGMPCRINGTTLTPDGAFVAVDASGWVIYPVRGGDPKPLPKASSVGRGARGAELLVQKGERLVVFEARSGKELTSLAHTPVFRSRFAPGPGNTIFVDDQLFDAKGEVVTKMPTLLLGENHLTVAFAPDGSWAVGGVGGIEGEFGDLVVTDRDGKVRASNEHGPVYSLAFSADSKRLFYSCGRGISCGMGPPFHLLHVVDAETLELLGKARASIYHWRFLDDRFALAAALDEQGACKLQVWDSQDLTAVETVPLDAPCYGFHLSDDRRTLVLSTQREVHVYRLTFDRKAAERRTR